MTTIAICGSMCFYAEMQSLAASLSAKGFSVFTPAAEETKIDYSAQSDHQLRAVKGKLIADYLDKIRNSDAVLIANFPKHGVPGYVGANALIEAAFAFALNKKIYLLYHLGDQPCRPELIGLQSEVIEGDLDLIWIEDSQRK